MPRVLQDLGIFLRANLWLVPILGGLITGLFYFVAPPPPMSATIAAGIEDGAYVQFAEKLKDELAKEGFKLNIVYTSGSRGNIQQLLAKNSKVQLGIMQSGQELELKDNEKEQLHSLGALFQEPIWLFKRADLAVDNILDLRDYKVAIGTPTGGTRLTIGPLLTINELYDVRLPQTWQPISGKKAAQALIDGEIDAAFFMGPAENNLIEMLAAHPKLDIMDFTRANAYQKRLPFLDTVDVSEGLLNLPNNEPRKNIKTMASAAVLVANEDFHPAITPLILQAAKNVMKDGTLIDDANTWPKATPESVPLLDEAAYFHSKGLPLLQRFLPFRIASLADRYIILVIPMIMVMFPLFKIAGPIYRWRIRARTYRWYKYLRNVDRRFNNNTLPEHINDELGRLYKLQDELSSVQVPLSYTHELYQLHLHVRYVIERLEKFKQQSSQPVSE
ncbi:TAXI family TRAP transporter solute-binding subunit [Pseudomonas sp. F1_0610]|uniref:TAXI family TRAP transporter solute-binding subunit n=1 Tax=Pseudomonas sp. F1_0610 TaxID=3114284 RepID=UPI0039C30A69